MNGETRLKIKTLLKRVAIIGPESSGKTWLAKKLASHYSTNLVDEYAREYFKDKNYDYTFDDLVEIAKGQIEKEEYIASISKNIIFCDTDMIVMKIWSKVVFDNVPEFIEKQIKEQLYDLYLLCYPDLKWEPDRLRSNPHNRQYIYELYIKELEQNDLNFRVVKGIGEQRFKNVLNFVDELLKDGNES